MLFKGIHCLINQRHAVGKKQYPLGPVAAHQHIGQCDHGARLAGAGGHYHQRLALVIHLEGFAYAAHGAGLVVAFDDVGVDNGIRQLLAAGAALNQQFQFRFLEKALNGARRIAGIIP